MASVIDLGLGERAGVSDCGNPLTFSPSLWAGPRIQ